VLGESSAAEQALEHALELVEPDAALLPFLLNPAPDLLERHHHHTTHPALVTEILSMLAGAESAPRSAGPRPLHDPLSESELRVLRYLPTNLTGPEIARELYISPNTVKTHMRNLYAKLGTHGRAESPRRRVNSGEALRRVSRKCRIRHPYDIEPEITSRDVRPYNGV
jgi:LuxR family transcriptional regulator, maltose regulon positive regulatory protein